MKGNEDPEERIFSANQHSTRLKTIQSPDKANVVLTVVLKKTK